MKRLTLATAALALALLPTFAWASDRFRGYSRSRDFGHYGGGHYGHYDRGFSRGSLGFSFGIFTGPRYYAPTYYRPVYRPYYAPPVYYYDPEPIYVPRPVYVAPPPRYYYDYDDCDDYYRPSASITFGYNRYSYRR